MIRGERNPAMGQGQMDHSGVRISFIILVFIFHSKQRPQDGTAISYLFLISVFSIYLILNKYF